MVEVVVTSNIDDLLDFLSNLGINIKGREPEILEGVGNKYMDVAKQTCPSPTSLVYPTNSTGFLRDSHTLIHIEANKVIIKPLARYAVFVHMGTMGVRARPWLEDAVKLGNQDIQNYVRDQIEKAVRQSA